MGLTKRWSIKEVDAQIVNELQVSLRVHPAICKMLVARGIHTFDQAKLFFRPQLTDLQISVLQAVLETSEQEGRDGFVSIFLIWPNISAMMPLNYAVYQDDLTHSIPSLQQDLQLIFCHQMHLFRFLTELLLHL